MEETEFDYLDHLDYLDWSAKKVEETEFERTARILGVLFPAPPISSATPISGNHIYLQKASSNINFPNTGNDVAERRSAQGGYGSPDPTSCYLEVTNLSQK